MDNNKNSSKLILFLGLVVAGLFLFYQYKKYRVPPSINLFKQHVYTSNGELISFDRYKGKKIIVTYYASWCGDCLREMISLNKVKLNDLKDTEVIAITDESEDKLIQFQKNKNYPFTFLRLNNS